MKTSFDLSNIDLLIEQKQEGGGVRAEYQAYTCRCKHTGMTKMGLKFLLDHRPQYNPPREMQSNETQKINPTTKESIYTEGKAVSESN